MTSGDSIGYAGHFKEWAAYIILVESELQPISKVKSFSLEKVRIGLALIDSTLGSRESDVPTVYGFIG